MLGINVQSLNMKNSPIGLHTMSGKNGVSNSCNIVVIVVMITNVTNILEQQ